MNDDLANYYAQRAAEYEAIYAKPERQYDLEKAATLLQEIFNGKNLLEIACGTGFWTEKIAQTARTIVATDINESVLEIARNKNIPNNNVHFEAVNMYQLQPEKPVEALFGGFIWSHIAIQESPDFIRKANSLVSAGGTVVMMDNRYVEGSSTPIFSRDEFGNTYQQRRLQNEEAFLVLKNFPTKPDIENALKDKAVSIRVIELQYFWIAIWQTAAP
jgi:SAM-dependent methyltransferase